MSAGVRLRPFREGDEAVAPRAHEALQPDDFTFLLGYRAGEPWRGYLDRLERRRQGKEVPAQAVPATLLAATVDDELVGRVSIRHTLNDFLAAYGGHIGYGVVPWERRKGYEKEILRQALVVARSVGIGRVLVICAAGNVASARANEACGGEFESLTVNPDHRSEPLRRYWIGDAAASGRAGTPAADPEGR